MEFLAGLYTLLLVAICLLQALLLHRTGKPAARQDDEALKEWLRQQLEAQARVLEEKQAQQAQQNLAAMAHISDTLQTAVQGMSSTLTAGQNTQQQTMEQRLQGLEASNARKLEEMRKALADGLAAMQAQNAQKLDEIRHTVDEQLQDALQKRVTESFKAVNDQLEQVYKGLGEMQSLAADVGGLKQVLSGVKTRGILGEIQLGAILEEILAPEQYDTNVATIPGSTQRVEYAIRMPGVDGNSVWLPIDSKFPGDTYAHLQDAQASGDAQAVENALLSGASGVFLAHNHPSGNAAASRNDITATRQVEMALESIEATLNDHIIFAGEDTLSFAQCGWLGQIKEEVRDYRREELQAAREQEAAILWGDSLL